MVEVLYHLNKEKNDIKEIKTMKQLDKVKLDMDSPKLKQAAKNLGLKIEEL